MRIVTKPLRLGSRGFRYEVVELYLSQLHIKFDDKVQVNSYEFHA